MLPCFAQISAISTPLDGLIKDVAAGGFSVIELWFTAVEEFLRGKSLAEIHRILAEHGVRVAAISAHGGLFRREEDASRLAWELFETRLRLAAELNAPIVVVLADVTPSDLPSTTDPVPWALEKLDRFATAAAAVGVQVALEFQARSALISNLGTAREFVEALGHPALGVCLDICQFHAGASQDADWGIDHRFLPLHVQIADWGGVPRELATDADRILPGEGDIPMSLWLEILRRRQYAGAISLELMNPIFWSLPPIQVTTAGFGALQSVLANVPDPSPSGGGFRRDE